VRPRPRVRKPSTVTAVVPETPVEEVVEDEHYGFRPGSDVAIVLEELIRGGDNKHDVANRIARRLEDRRTKGGNPKPVSTVMNQVQSQMTARGFTVQSGWRLVPPVDGVLGPRPKRKVYAKKKMAPTIKSKVVMPPRKKVAVATDTPDQPKRRPVKPKPKPRLSGRTKK
jgi:hypothetical protein